MVMDEQEICCFIREARDPLTRITICAQMNLCKPQEIRKICEKNGLKFPKSTGRGRHKKWSEDKIEAIKQELAKGKKKKDVARQFGMTVYGLSYVIKRYIPERRKKKAPDVGAPGAAVETT